MAIPGGDGRSQLSIVTSHLVAAWHRKDISRTSGARSYGIFTLALGINETGHPQGSCAQPWALLPLLWSFCACMTPGCLQAPSLSTLWAHRSPMLSGHLVSVLRDEVWLDQLIIQPSHYNVVAVLWIVCAPLIPYLLAHQPCLERCMALELLKDWIKSWLHPFLVMWSWAGFLSLPLFSHL